MPTPAVCSFLLRFLSLSLPKILSVASTYEGTLKIKHPVVELASSTQVMTGGFYLDSFILGFSFLCEVSIFYRDKISARWSQCTIIIHSTPIAMSEFHFLAFQQKYCAKLILMNSVWVTVRMDMPQSC